MLLTLLLPASAAGHAGAAGAADTAGAADAYDAAGAAGAADAAGAARAAGAAGQRVPKVFKNRSLRDQKVSKTYPFGPLGHPLGDFWTLLE